MIFRRPLHIIRRMLLLLSCIWLMTSCDVHEFPEVGENINFILRLHYETDMTIWEHIYDHGTVKEIGIGETYDNSREYGEMRYVIRAYPHDAQQRSVPDYVREYVFTRNIADGYDCEFNLELPAGEYDIKVWSDQVESTGDQSFYNATDFSEVTLQGSHKGNDDYRDAFRGSTDISLVTSIIEHVPDVVDITMQRPLAKYEFITNDLKEFIDKELELLTKEAESRGAEAPSRINTDDYKVVFYYVGFMPNTYNINTDKPIDSAKGVFFESKLNNLNSFESSLGFDYVFVNGKSAGVLVQIALYDDKGQQISITEPIEVPLRRSHHTVLRGTFLMQQASGGITIDPDFDGEHNVLI